MSLIQGISQMIPASAMRETETEVYYARVMDEQTESSKDKKPGPAWTFRGYRLGPSNFSTAMAHLYRGEMSRANTWRTRLDATTNWAVITVAGALTFTFGSPQNPHYVLLLVLMLVFTFLSIEARRYAYYALWSYRVRMMETDYFAAMFTPPFRPSSDWSNFLSKSLKDPSFPIPRWEAVGRRFRSIYFWLVTLLLISWGVKLALHPFPASDINTIIERARIGLVPGFWVATIVTLAYAVVCLLAILVSLPSRWREVVPEFLTHPEGPPRREPASPERLATIITTKGDEVAQKILEELGRGVTALRGTGMYTGERRDVLLSAVTDVQIPHLQDIVRKADDDAFVVVSPAEEVRGGGFRPFEPPS